MTQTCRHGLRLTETCRECDLDRARETVRRYGDDVDQARIVIASSRNLLIAKLVDDLEKLEALNRRRN